MKYYQRTHTWHSSQFGRMKTTTGYFLEAHLADQCLVKLLREAGYKRPRWWQFWRWGERPLTLWGDE